MFYCLRKTNMNIDKVFFYVVYLYLNFRTAYNISLLSIVHFKCSSYFIKSEKCCAGTIIYPNFILTSAFCAESCDTILMRDMKIPINNIFIHPHYKKYVKGQHILETNDIALVMVTSHPKAVTLKLSAMEVISAIGLKALIPILDDNKPRLLVTVIQSCSKHLLLRSYHICSIGTLCNRVFNNCQYTKGLPLLIDGRIVGLTGVLSSKLCNFPQIFTAVGPIIPWIRSVIINNREDSLQNSFQVAKRFDKMKLQSINLQNIDLKSGYKQYQQKEITIPTKNSTSYNLYSKMQETNMNKLPSIRKFITSSTLYETLIKSVLKTKFSVPIKKNITELTYFTQIPDTNLLKTSESLNTSSSYSAMRFATNAMDWFNKNVRNKLKDKPSPLLVLTAPRINYYKEFVDLT